MLHVKMWIFQCDELDSLVNLGELPAGRFRAITVEASIAYGEHTFTVSNWGVPM